MTDVVAIIGKNAHERIHVELSEFKGQRRVGVRVDADKGGGEWVPDREGHRPCCLRISRLCSRPSAMLGLLAT